MKQNADTLAAEMRGLAKIIDIKMKLYWNQPSDDFKDITELAPPDLSNNESPYASILKHYQRDFFERIVL